MDGVAKLPPSGTASTFSDYSAELVLETCAFSTLLLGAPGHPKIPEVLAIRLLDLF